MLWVRRLLGRVPTATCLALTFGVGGSYAQRITVGPNVQVSRARLEGTHNEVLMAADPGDASHLLACSYWLPPGRGLFTVVYASFDGGKSWSLVLIDSTGADGAKGRFSKSDDPACAFGPNGAAYFSRLPLEVYYSTDAGRTWGIAAVPAEPFQDRDFLSIDLTKGTYHGRVYVYAQHFDRTTLLPTGITLWRSLDGGKTFEQPVQRSWGSGNTAFHPGTSVILSDGTWAAVFDEAILSKRNDGLGGARLGPASEPNGALRFITSVDGGRTLGDVVTVSDAYVDWRQMSIVSVLAVDDRSAGFRDRLYVVWTDGRFCGRDQVVISMSSDHAKNWTPPRIVNDDLRCHDTGDLERNVGLVSAAVNQDGVVGVIWEDRRNNTADEVGYEIRFSASFDGGETFGPSVKVSEQARVVGRDEQWVTRGSGSGPVFNVYRDEWGTGGDTMGLVADATGVFHALWVDNRTGVHQVWTAPITARGTVARHGAQELARLEDVSSQVAIDVLRTSFDRATRRLEAVVRLRNSSPEKVCGPLKVRALAIRSEVSTTGTAQVIGSDNSLGGTGAVWDFSGLPDSGTLAPDALTEERTLVFYLPGIRGLALGPGRTLRWGNAWWPPALLHVEGQVLAGGGSCAAIVVPGRP